MSNKVYTVPLEFVPGSGGGGGSGTVTQVNTAGIATGGPITTTGTVTVAGSGNTTTAATAAASIHSAPAGDVVTTDGSGNVQDSGTLLSSLAPLASPTFTGVPAAPTASGGTNTTQLATTAFVQAAVGAAVTSVSNSDGTLTISPTTGAVVASIALGHANTWSGTQIFGTITPTTISGNPNFSGTPTFANPVALGSSTATTQAGGTNNTTLATTAFVQAAIGASGAVVWNNIGNATGNLTLANGTNTTTFNQTSNVAWLWANTTTATSGTTNNSPILELVANYWTGGASSPDTWSINSALVAGTNGISTLAVSHAGSTGNSYLSLNANVGLQFATTPAMIDNTTTSWTLDFTHGSGTAVDGVLQGSSTGFALGVSAVNKLADVFGRITTSATSAVVLENSGSFTGTSGTQSGVSIGGSAGTKNGLTFNPASGSASFVACNIAPTIEGTSNGNTWGLLVNPTLTATNLTGTNLIADFQSGGTSQFNVDYSGNVKILGGLTQANPTVATVSTTNASPIQTFSANYWTGAASAADTWTIGSSLASGTNGASTLTIGHSGSTGQATVALPNVSTSGTITTAAGKALQLGGGTQLNITPSSTTQTIRAFQQGASLVFQGNLTTTAGFQHTLQDATNAQSATSGISGLVTVSPASGGLGWAPTSGAGTYQILQVQQTINQTSTASGSYTGIMLNVAETALLGTSNNLLDLQAGSSGTTSKFTITNTGKISTYNGVATVRAGIPAIYQSSDLTAQSAAITATNISASLLSTAVRRISWSATITTAASTSSVLGGANGFQVTYTSPTDSVVKTTVAGETITSSANTTGTATSGVLVVYAKVGTALSYTFDYTSVGVTAMVYELHITVESLGP